MIVNATIKKMSKLALVALLVTAGCSDTLHNKVTSKIDNDFKNAKKEFEKRNSNMDVKNHETVRYSNKIWLGSRGFRQQNGDPLPNKYDHVTYMSGEPQTLNEIVSDVSSMTGMRFIVNDKPGGGAGSSSDAGATVPGEYASTSVTGESGPTFALSYTGDFMGLLNHIASKYDMHWEYKEGVVYLSKYVTATLALYSLPSTTDSTSSITSESDSSEGGTDGSATGQQSGTDNKIEMKTELKIWEEIKDVVESMLPDDGSVEISPSSGTLTVTASPLVVKKVENLIKKQNEILSRQVIIDVNIMTILTRDSEDFKLDLQRAFLDASSKLDLEWGGPVGSLRDLLGSAGQFSANYISGDFEADAFLDLLAEKFEQSVVTNATVTTLNNHAVPLQIITRETYLKERSVIKGTDGNGDEITLTPGDLTTGLVMNLLPKILSSGDVMLQYSMSLSENLGIETYVDPNGQSSIQLPTIASRDFLQNIKLKSGNSLILAGYERDLNKSLEVGTGKPKYWQLGGGKENARTKEVLVIMLTPRILN